MPPVVSDLTARLYGRLPELYRAADETAGTGAADYPLLRFLSLIVDQAGEVEELVDRIDRRRPEEGGDPADTSDLVDPAVADAAWLPWLAQLVGVNLDDVTDVPARSELLASAEDLLAHGSDRAIRARVQPLLSGTGYLLVETNHLGSPWNVLLITLATETDDVDELLAEAGLEKPAGVVLTHDFGITWDEYEAAFPTWADIDAAGSWSGLTP